MTTRVIPIMRYSETLAELVRARTDLKMARANLTLQNEIIARLVAALNDIAPHHKVLRDLDVFLQKNEAADAKP